MHPMERLRSVARARGAAPGVLVQEAAQALAMVASDPAGLVVACRRLLARHPNVGPLWWLASRVLCSPEPAAEAWRAAGEVAGDTTPSALAAALPDGATVVLAGRPDLAVEGVCRRGDVEVLLPSSSRWGEAAACRLDAASIPFSTMGAAWVGTAAAEADLVVVEADALGAQGLAAAPGARAAAAAGRAAGVPVWVVAGVGRGLPAKLWAAVESAVQRDPAEPWERPAELVPLRLFDLAVGPEGPVDPVELSASLACTLAPELLRPLT